MTKEAKEAGTPGALRLLIVCGAALVVAMAVLIAVVSSNSSGVAGFERAEGLLFPGLESRIDEVQRVEIRDARNRITLARRDKGWVLEERDGYPVLDGKVEGLLSAFAQARTIYGSTKEPSNHTDHGLTETNGPAQTSATAATITPVKVTLMDGQGNRLAHAVLGNTLSTPNDPRSTSIFVRKDDSERIWLTSADLQVEADPLAWVNRTILDIPRDRIQEAVIVSNPQDQLVIRREPPDASTFTAHGLPENSEIPGRWALDMVAAGLERLTFEDVRKTEPIQSFESLQPPKALFQRQDGVKVAVSLERGDKGTWVEMRAMPGETQGPGQNEGAAVKEEVARLNERLQGWAYRIPSHRSETLQTTPAQVVERR